MKFLPVLTVAAALALKSFAADAEFKPIEDAMKFAHKAPKVTLATEDVVAKKDGAGATYKQAANCKACHSDHKAD